jgi:hypothetical protein
MNSKIKYQESNNSLLVEIKPDPKPIVKFGMLFFYVMPFAIFIVLAFVIISQNRNLIDDKNLLLLGMIIGSGILVYIFLRKIFEKEIMIVDNKNLTLLKRFLFDRKKSQLNKKEIKDLKYVGREEFTDHPLDTKGFDYLGLGTGEKEVQWFIESGNLTFNYKGSNFRFGKNIWEEEGNELIEKLKKYGCQQGV